MVLNGVDIEGLAEHNDIIEYPPVVDGRTVHIDADFLAYMTTAEKSDGTLDKTYEEMQHNAEVAVNALRRLAAAEHQHLHLTPSESNKGFRYDAAMLKPYQGNRVDKPKPRYLGIMRKWLAERYNGTLHTECEADDGMSSAQYAAIASGNRTRSIIASKDKDLCMVPGLHLDWDTGEIIDTGDDWGYVELFEHTMPSGVVKKLKGFGQKFFWAQMLIGDPADNISGLPLIPGSVMNKIKPTKDIEKALEVLASDTASAEKKAKAQTKIEERKHGECGPATAILLLDMMKNPQTAFAMTKALYKACGEQIGFKHYRDDAVLPWGQAFASEGRLLWMRRDKHNADCVLDYWRSCATAA